MMKMTVTMNGQPQSLPEEMRLAEAVSRFFPDSGPLVVERNGRFVRPGEWAETPLADGDVLEMIQFVGGG
jgi:thiamine biosynthesis protein ThiS